MVYYLGRIGWLIGIHCILVSRPGSRARKIFFQRPGNLHLPSLRTGEAGGQQDIGAGKAIIGIDDSATTPSVG